MTQQLNKDVRGSQITILHDEQCPIICYHPDKGSFQLVCPFCKGNSQQQPGTTELEFIAGPSGLYAHIRQVHETDVQELGMDQYMSLRIFQQAHVIPECVDRWLTAKEAYDIRTSGGISKAAIASIPGNTNAMFPVLHPERFPCVVLRRDLKWVELRCPVLGCNTNVKHDTNVRNISLDHNQHLQGVLGFQQHMCNAHGIKAPVPATKWDWVIEQCTSWTPSPEVDVEQLETGQYNIPLVFSTLPRDPKSRSSARMPPKEIVGNRRTTERQKGTC